MDNDGQNNGYLCKYLLLDLGKPEGDYLFEVTDSGIMTISSGDLNDDFYDKVLYEDSMMEESLYDYNFLKEVRTKDTIRLSSAELERLRNCIYKIKDVKLVNPFVQSIWRDIETHMVIINENKSVFVYIPSEDFSEFLKTLLELTHREWKDHYNSEILLDYKEHRVHECQVPDSIDKSCWQRIKEWFDK
ncbi:MAG: hypothetical protein K2G12_10660 [Prevotella sp.]|nr:hypothetical protein [Prevotella sp.]